MTDDFAVHNPASVRCPSGRLFGQRAVGFFQTKPICPDAAGADWRGPLDFRRFLFSGTSQYGNERPFRSEIFELKLVHVPAVRLGNVCQPQSTACRRVVFSNARETSAGRGVTVKQNFPLPTESGLSRRTGEARLRARHQRVPSIGAAWRQKAPAGRRWLDHAGSRLCWHREGVV